MKYITLLLLLISLEMYSQTTPGEYTIKNVITNTKYSDFGTSFFGKDKVVFASPKDNTVLTKKTWSGNNQPFLDLYIGTINEKGEIIGKQRVIGDVNNKFHEGIVSFTKDLKTVYFSANNYTENNKAKRDSTGIVNIQLYKATVRDNGEWHDVVKLPFNSDEYSTGHPALNKDDTKLYFISDRPGSIGKTDIYVVAVNEDGTYGTPKNMGPKINTEEREMFPFISDEDILYFSSDGHLGYGALDVFASRIFDKTVSEPINLDDPVNSSGDDFAFIINDDKHKGYFSSNNRKDGKGDDDIYSFIAFPPLKIEGEQVISGVVFDKISHEFLPGAIVLLLDEEGNELQRTTASAKANSNLSINIDKLNKNNRKNTSVITGDASDIQVKKTVDNLNPKTNEEVEFTVEITNNGKRKAKGIKISDVLPEGYEYVSDNGVGKYQPDTDILLLPNLASGEKAILKIKAIAPVDALNKDNQKNTSVADGEVSDIKIKKTVDKETPDIGEEVEFTVEITNKGSGKATEIKLSDVLPEGYEYVSDDSSGVYQSGIDILTVPSLASGEKTTIKIKTKRIMTANDAAFSFDVKSNTNYKIAVVAPGYLREEIAVKTTNDTNIEPVELDINLDQELRVVDEKIMININTIYFDFDKWNIRPEAAKELDKVIAVMKDHPSMLIEAGSHTDSRATEAYNQRLSEKRAKSTVDYIVARGIDRSRIVAKGYGEMQLVNNCSSFVTCSREEHQLNRRTEFVIVNDNDRFTSTDASIENVKIDRKINRTFVEIKSSQTNDGKKEKSSSVSDEAINKESTSNQASTINIPPIYFDFDKWSISDTEKKQLDKVVQIMKDNPTIIIEASSHTDSKNLESYNQLLSEKRAKSVVNYIVSKGINPNRIVGKGYGEMRLTNHCKSFVKCTPEEQQANRRTEFKIIKM